MSLIAIVAVALVLAVAGRLVRLAVRIALLLALIALVVSYGARHTRHHGRPSPSPPTTQRHHGNQR